MAPWHPFRQPGMCGQRGTLCVLIVISLCIVLPIWWWEFQGRKIVKHENYTTTVPPSIIHRQKRETVYKSPLLDAPCCANFHSRRVNDTSCANSHITGARICQPKTSNFTLCIPCKALPRSIGEDPKCAANLNWAV